ncbi:hypothetical protein D9756_003681 [Leucocoprinus leucothites]|uniref:DUF6533 domain-containing protein n=1 Tax=Leucocoprinus leucothites TaxID=201217 RepID=A0A8H5D920_9AGAR|nr:hypothetical protein D9756_003681 [Leucoagaricus leucothites]
MSDQLSQYTPEFVSSALRVLYLQHYCQLVAFMITFYDHALTFDKEVELIWVGTTILGESPQHSRNLNISRRIRAGQNPKCSICSADTSAIS